MDISLLKYPLKSHRKTINIPSDSEELAELFGIAFGDGGINNEWQLVITLNSVSDLKYSSYVCDLLRKLFEIRVFTKKRPNQNALVIVCSSTDLVDFLVDKGCVRGNKVIHQIEVPDWIDANIEYKKRFVRGLVDTDGCLYIHRHFVNNALCHNIGFCFTNHSKKLINSVEIILKEIGIRPHITDEGRRIYLYNAKDIFSYLNIFGSSNPRIYEKYREWLDIKKEKNNIHFGDKVWRGSGVA